MVGKVTLSLEIELGWGVKRYDNMSYLSEKGVKEREYLKKLLQLCDDLKIPITFDIVGHLMLDSPLCNYDSPHCDDWFEIVPDPESDEAGLYFAPEIIKWIREADVEHEICTHTFSHVEMGTVNEDILYWELEKVSEIHENNGIGDPVSIVPPTHDPPPREVLRAYDIDILRIPEYRIRSSGRPNTRFKRFYETLLREHPVIEPEIKNGIVESYSSSNLSIGSSTLARGQGYAHPAFRMLPIRVRRQLHLKKMENAIEDAVKHNSYTHHWSHLYDISNKQQWQLTTELLIKISQRVKNGEVRVLTMKDLAEDTLDRNSS